MRTRLLRLLAALSALLFVAVMAHAEDVLAGAKIPFSFEVGKTTLPAGTYVIEKIGPPGLAYLIKSTDGTQACFFSAVGAEPKNSESTEWKLVFDRVGNENFLRDVWLGPEENGLVLSKSKHESEVLAMGNIESRIEIAEAGH